MDRMNIYTIYTIFTSELPLPLPLPLSLKNKGRNLQNVNYKSQAFSIQANMTYPYTVDRRRPDTWEKRERDSWATVHFYTEHKY